MGSPALAPQNLNEDYRSTIIACDVFMVVLATIAVATRFYARWVKRDRFRLDDYLVACALVFAWSLTGTIIFSAEKGLGLHFQEVLRVDAPSALISEQQAYYASTILFAIALSLTKISTLLLYVRSFGDRHSLRVAAWVIGTFTGVWCLVVIIGSCLRCQPLSALWDSSVEGTCINSWLFSIVTGALNTTTDFILLLLPAPFLFGAQLSRFARFSLIGVFAGGFIVCVFSILRLIALNPLQASTDLTWSQGMVAIWTAAEPSLAILVVSLPTFAPLLFRDKRNSIPAAPSTPSLGLLPQSRSPSPKSSRRSPISFDWPMIQLGKFSKSAEEESPDAPREGVIEVRTTWETRHSYRKMSV